MNLSSRRLLGVLFAGTLFTPLDAFSGEPDVGMISFTPPDRGAPSRRIGGGSRGDKTQLLMAALVPPQTGQTAQAQPTLYWFISRAVNTPMDFAVTIPGEETPLVESRLAGPTKPGIQSIDLAKLGVKLKPGIEYQWSVSLVNNESQRSADTFVAGALVRTADGNGNPVLCGKPEQMPQAAAYASQGLWYDALQCLSQLAEKGKRPEYRAKQASLLAQGDLKAVVDWLAANP
ncbi:exported hypothetical protein [Gammaproteobacteria bacterium]